MAKSFVARNLTALARLMRNLVDDEARPQREASVPQASRPKTPVAYRRVERFFTASEQAFFDKLLKAVGSRYVIMSKVRLLDLVDPIGDELERFAGKGRVAQKHLDFVLLRPGTYEIVAALELDGLSHLKLKQLRRDEQKTRTLESVGIPLLRFSSMEVHTPEMIWERLRPLAVEPTPQTETVVGSTAPKPQQQSPTCRKCGRTMVLKQNDKGPFWACPGFPRCRNVFPA